MLVSVRGGAGGGGAIRPVFDGQIGIDGHRALRRVRDRNSPWPQGKKLGEKPIGLFYDFRALMRSATSR